MMRTLCPNLEREDGLETVLEVPAPEENFPARKNNHKLPWKSWMTKSSAPAEAEAVAATSVLGCRSAEIQLLLGVVGAPLIPIPVPSGHRYSCSDNINDHPIESSMAKYIIHQYIASSGGENAINSIESMYAMGKVKMVANEFISSDGLGTNIEGKMMKIKSVRSNNNNDNIMNMNNNNGKGIFGSFVLWQKRLGLWSLEMVVNGCKISAGCDGKLAWRQTPWQNHSHASHGPPRPLRRSIQGLDPRSTANLFSNSICTGEKTVNDEECFVLKLDANAPSLKARNSRNVEVIKHTLWGYFSQRTGLLVKFEDSHILKIKTRPSGNNHIFWETTMESLVQDYRTVNGVNVAHAGQTSVTLFRYGESEEGNTRTRMEEVWSIEEVDFNIKGLSMDCFLAPSDLKKEDNNIDNEDHVVKKDNVTIFRSNSIKLSSGKGVKIVAIDEDDDLGKKQ